METVFIPYCNKLFVLTLKGAVLSVPFSLLSSSKYAVSNQVQADSGDGCHGDSQARQLVAMVLFVLVT